MADQRLARLTGLLYALNVAIGLTALYLAGNGHARASMQLNIFGGAEYAIVVLLLARLLEPAGRAASWAVAAVGLAGCALTPVAFLHLMPAPSPLPVFGLYCLGLGLLIARSGLLPRVIGLLLMVGGVSWLTFAWPALSHRLQPWSTAAGASPEIILTLWLILFGIRTAALGGARRVSAAVPAVKL